MITLGSAKLFVICSFVRLVGITSCLIIIGYDLFILGITKSEKLDKYFVLPLPLFGKEWIHKLNNENTFWGSRHLYLFIRKDFKKVSSLINDLKNF